jgi:prepilin-type processing-associated H-X9-DG protein
MKMGNKTYNIWFQDGHIMATISARDNSEARVKFNRMIKVKETEDAKGQ